MRLAKVEDLENIMKIIDGAKLSLKEDGVDQWQRGFPSREMVLSDISIKEGYLLEKDGEILAYAYLKKDQEEDYKPFEDKFLFKNYLTIHRFCVNRDYRNQGIAYKFFEEIKKWAIDHSFSAIRIDTHRANKKMRGLIGKAGFREVVTVFVDDNGIPKERIAYEMKI